MGNNGKPILKPIDSESKAKFVDVALRDYRYFYYKKINNDTYKCWCSNCNTDMKFKKIEMNQIKKAHLCPNCYNDVIIKTNKHPFENKILGRINDAGYCVSVVKEVGNQPKVHCRQVAYWTTGKRGAKHFYARGIKRTMSYYIDFSYNPNDNEFKLKHTNVYYCSIEDMFVDINKISEIKTYTKKEYLSSYEEELKSNQKKICIDNILNHYQIEAMRVFDLKTIKEIHKYNKWINENARDMQYHKTSKTLNIYYLDYLSRNNIRFSDFVDFMYQCDMLGIKLWKPKDFKKAHEELSKEFKFKKDEIYDKNIQERYLYLQRNILESKDYTIKPLSCSKEIVDVSKQLHNCMASCYLEKYAKGQTDLYAMFVNGVAVIGIEVLNNKLWQVRAKYNNDPTKKQNKIVKNWFEKVVLA